MEVQATHNFQVGARYSRDSLPDKRLEARTEDKIEAESSPVKDFGKLAGNIKDGLVDPLKSTLVLSRPDMIDVKDQSIQTKGQILSLAGKAVSPAVKEISADLGVAGTTLGGISGVSNLVEGIRTGDITKTLDACTNVTLSASAFASLGIIGGAALLAPAGTVLVGVRGLKNVQKKDRDSHLAAAGDLLTVATFASKLLPVAAAVPIGLGVGATVLGGLGGLRSIKKGVEAKNSKLLASGVAQAAAALGVAMVATGVAVGPGIAVILGSVSLPLVRKLKKAKPKVDKAIDWAAQKLYPMAVRTESMLDKVAPTFKPIQNVVSSANSRLQPVLKPAAEIGSKFMKLAQKGTQWLSKTWVFQRLGDGLEKINVGLGVLTDGDSDSSISPGNNT